MNQEHCGTCGAAVRVEGGTTRYYVPIADERVKELEESKLEQRRMMLEELKQLRAENLNMREALQKLEQAKKACGK